jgi:hypothetical protein
MLPRSMHSPRALPDALAVPNFQKTFTRLFKMDWGY